MVTEASAADQVAEVLLRIGAVELRPTQPFTFSSGMRSPIYTDNRLLCSAVAERRLVSSLLEAALTSQHIAVDVIAGAATAGIPHAAWLAERMNLPMVYVRGSAKEHGRGKRVEGRITSGQRAVMVEDMFSTGGSVIDAVRALREDTGAVVTHCLGICTYSMPRADRAFAEADLTPVVLTDFATIVRVAAEHGYLAPDQQQIVLDWQRDPATWSERTGITQ